MRGIATEMLINLIESKYPIEEFETKILDLPFILVNKTKLQSQLNYADKQL